ncbi:MAG: Gfo/Idh/MocA family oxidoreductase [Clostridia bacterium]|nr:Gfo/Idh/MocA family oxidoreductase [Clostridia bacterium]
MEKKELRVAVVGCGVISYNHLTALKTTNGVKVIALCDVNAEKAEARRKEFSLDAKIYTDYYEMLDSEQLDAVHIATPHYLHAPMTVAALKRDIYVLLEKPMCITTEEIELIKAAERESRADVTVCFQTRYNKANVVAKKIAEEDGIVSAYFTLLWQRSNEYYTESDWRGRLKTEGGGVMINQAIHSLDHLISLLGKPIAVTATKSNHAHRGVIDVEDTCEGVVEFEGGLRGNFYATNAFIGASRTSIFVKTKNHRLEVKNSLLYVDDKLVEDTEAAEHLGKEVYGNGHPTLIAKFYAAIRAGEPMPIPTDSAEWSVRLLLAAYRSCGERVEI